LVEPDPIEVRSPEFGPPFSVYQAEIFMRGINGELPALPISITELERTAHEHADPRVAAYAFGGAGTEDTMRANLEAFRRWRIVPRLLRDVSVRDLSVTVLGTRMVAPIALAPIGMQTMVHPEGELAAARAAAAVGLPMSVSTLAGRTLEDIAAASTGPKWFQLYWPRDPELAASLLSRAEAAGYDAILVTLDAFLPGWKPRDLQSAWQPYLDGLGIANYVSDPVFRSLLQLPPEESPAAAVGEFLVQFSNPGLQWHDLEFLRSRTALPIALKGVLHPDDALAARDHGIEGIVVSNHGGRQVDGAIAALDALPPIVDAVGGDLSILLDSGVRSGADVVKALALGADAVLIGRPYLWGLTVAGEDGVLAVLRAVLAELDLTVGLAGHARVADLDRGMLVRS
jgi:lactate 2-monooxygenase